jgi:hypothetical protein
MKATPLIRKSSGEMEHYSSEKLRRSLQRSGADKETIELILKDIESWIYDGISSRKIHDRAFAMLRKNRLGSAARYRLKKAMMEMGPTGHPFEFFVGEVFRIKGYDVEVAQVLDGHCVTHEVDVVATKNKHQIFLECKYYQTTGKNANVQVPLYIRSRVDDIIRMRKENPAYREYTFSGGVVTNTRFTEDAEAYGKCSGLMLLSWDYPAGESLKEIVDREKIFPVTALTRLSLADKQVLMEKGIVICRQLFEHPDILDNIDITGTKKDRVLEEARELAINGSL